MNKIKNITFINKFNIIIIALFGTLLITGCKHHGDNTSNNANVEKQNKIEIRGIGYDAGNFPIYEGGILEIAIEFINDGPDYSGYWFTHTVRFYKKNGDDFVPLPSLGVTLLDPIPGLNWKSGERRFWIFDKMHVQGAGRYKYVVELITPTDAIENDVENNSVEYEFDVIKYPSEPG